VCLAVLKVIKFWRLQAWESLVKSSPLSCFSLLSLSFSLRSFSDSTLSFQLARPFVNTMCTA
jgi:hypothetical protein